MKDTKKFTKALVESSIMVAFATVLSLIKVIEMPYGGSVTPASMLPIVIISYRHGMGMGLMSGVVYAALQQLLGLNNLSYVTGWQSVLAVIILDYILAFTVAGLGGLFRGRLREKGAATLPASQRLELGLGMGTVCVLRYILHTVAGATVWAGLSIPTEAALVYSIGYNATYMIPETIVGVLVAVWLSGILDFTKDIPVRFPAGAYGERSGALGRALPALSLLMIFGAVIADTVMIAPHLQDAEDGHFTFDLLSSVPWVAVIIVSAVCVAVAAAGYVASYVLKAKAAKA